MYVFQIEIPSAVYAFCSFAVKLRVSSPAPAFIRFFKFKAIPHKERAESCVVPRKRGTADIFVRLAKFDAGLLTQVKENLVKMTE